MDNTFKEKREEFLIRCNEMSSNSSWDEKELGVLNVYYNADLLNVVLYLVASDEKISQEEVDFINETFGFEYEIQDLQEIYSYCSDPLKNNFDDVLKKDINLLNGLDESLGTEFKELLLMVCKLVIESDGVIAEEEKGKAKELAEKIS